MKMPRYIILFLSLLLLFQTSQAQDDKRANVWYFGYKAGIDFNGGTPKALNNSQMRQWEGTASICDEEGKLLLYTNGIQIWNHKHRIISGASDLGGNDTSTESAIIVPKPGSSTLYYVFTTHKQLALIIIDITLNKGEGGIISKTILMKNATEKLAVVHHCNKKDFWIVAHESGNDVFKSYLLTGKGLEISAVSSKIGSKYNDGASLGYLRFSPTGSKLAAAIFGGGVIELYDFDNNAGKISNLIPVIHPDFKMAYGIEFSPDENYMYVTQTLFTAKRIFQLDVSSKKSVEILKSKTTIGQTTESYFGALKLGPDHKIYVAKNKSRYLGVINEPNRKGLKCTYVSDGLELDAGISGIGLPNFVESFNQETSSVSIDQERDCQNITLTARFSSFLPNISYQWYQDGSVISQADQDTYKPDRSGFYSVVVSNSCSNEKVFSDTVQVNILSAEPKAIKVNCGFYQLLANANGSIQWTGENITDSQQSADSIVVSNSGTKVYVLKVFDKEDPTCFIEKELTIDFGICDASVFAPDIFTPNQDGINDTFKLMIKGGKLGQLDIYNRWGTKIFSSSDAEWDGKVNGADCPGGNYVYVLKYTTEKGGEYERRGSVLLQR
jgi:gliding motility-associated-like protein